jgi:DNA integrity scanning protein DisA with diadenylate cyclase activity
MRFNVGGVLVLNTTLPRLVRQDLRSDPHAVWPAEQPAVRHRASGRASYLAAS